MRDRLLFIVQLAFTLAIAAFLIVPALLSMLAGVTVNYFRGISSGVTLQWVFTVWQLYADTIARSLLIAFGTLSVTLGCRHPRRVRAARAERAGGTAD
jgi:putative spermidine/putrescine transport system permease protein